MEVADELGLPPGYKFDPDDDELVAHFLLPRLQFQRLPFDGIILEDDPLSAPPWKLLDKHKRKEDAFFFAAGQAKSGKGSRQKRTCAGGGCWEGQKVCVDGEKLRVPGSGMEISWRKYALNFHADGEKGSTGWVMHEYGVTAPAELASSPLRLYRIRFSGHGKKRKRAVQDLGGDDGGSRAAPRRAMAEAALPLLEECPSALQPVCRSVVVVDLVDDDDGADLGANAVPEATSSDHGWSAVMDDLSFLDYEIPENMHELMLSCADDFNLPAVEGSGVRASADCAAPTTSECSAAPAGTSWSDQGSSTVDVDLLLNYELPKNIEELLQTLNYDDFSVPETCGLQAEQGPGAHLDADDFNLPAAEGSGVRASADCAAPTTSECSAAPAGTSWSDQGSSTVDVDLLLNFELPENIEELLQTLNYDDFSVPETCGLQAEQGPGAHLDADGAGTSFFSARTA